MSVKEILTTRSGAQCELCGDTTNLDVFNVEPSNGAADQAILACDKCRQEIEGEKLDQNHWRCLNDSMWSQEIPVQVMSWRMLKRLSSETWAQDLVDMMYLDEESMKWAEAGLPDEDAEPTLDCNGARLKAGDNVTLVKDLDVKGAGFTAKRGTVVRNISLTNNPKHIEGKVNGTTVVLVAEYMKKA